MKCDLDISTDLAGVSKGLPRKFRTYWLLGCETT